MTSLSRGLTSAIRLTLGNFPSYSYWTPPILSGRMMIFIAPVFLPKYFRFSSNDRQFQQFMLTSLLPFFEKKFVEHNFGLYEGYYLFCEPWVLIFWPLSVVRVCYCAVTWKLYFWDKIEKIASFVQWFITNSEVDNQYKSASINLFPLGLRYCETLI